MNNRTRPRSRYPSMALLPRVIAHDLEGSRFGACLVALAIFVPALRTAAKCCNRRLPRNTQRDAFTPGFWIRLRPAHRAAERWVVPGSRLLPHGSARFVMERIREGDETRAKAAPVQTLGDQHGNNVPPSRTRTTTRTILLMQISPRKRRASLPMSGRRL